MLDFALTHDSLEEKCYTCENILNNYILDWKFYNQFKHNIELMLKENNQCNIALILFNDKKSLLQILKKYPNNKVKEQINERYSWHCIYI
jgi:hypothetical protein